MSRLTIVAAIATPSAAQVRMIEASWDQTPGEGDVVFCGGHVVFDGGYVVFAGGDVVFAGGDVVFVGGDVVFVGGDIVFCGGDVFRMGKEEGVTRCAASDALL